MAALIAKYRALRNWVYAHHFNFDLYTDLMKKANGGNFLGPPEAADSRMGGHFICPFRLLRLRNVQIQLVTSQVKSSKELPPKYIEQDTKQRQSSQFAERAGSELKACSSCKELRGLSVSAQVRV